MISAIRNKLRSISGESLGETAASLLVASLALLMLAGSVVTSGKINAEADATTTLAAQVSSDYEPSKVSVKMTYGGADGDPKVESVYEGADLYDAGGLYYYESHAETEGSGS